MPDKEVPIEEVPIEDIIKSRLTQEALDLFYNSDLHPFVVALVLMNGYQMPTKHLLYIQEAYPEDFEVLIKIQQKIKGVVSVIEEYRL
jgi:hypothetical protein